MTAGLGGFFLLFVLNTAEQLCVSYHSQSAKVLVYSSRLQLDSISVPYCLYTKEGP